MNANRKENQLLEKSQVDDFRAIIRTLAVDSNVSIPTFLHNTFDQLTEMKEKKMMLSFENFQSGLSKFNQLKQKFSTADLEDVFQECENDSELIAIDELADFCQRTISKVRAMALKLRNAIIKEYVDDKGYREAFTSLTKNKYIDTTAFIEFAEDMLGININDNDGLDLYKLYDMDGDKKISVEDFLGFILGKTIEGIKVLDRGNPNVIVDIQISVNAIQEAELLRTGYTQISPNNMQSMGPTDIIAHGTFGKVGSTQF
jgi:Ca2+-binding EF-hand superfamily protein